MNRYVIILLLSILLCGCSKPDKIIFVITGTLIDSTTNEPISGVNVSLEAKLLETGTFNNNFQSITSTTSNAAGEFELCLEKGNIGEIRINYQGEEYFTKVEELTSDDLNAGQGGDYSQILDPTAYAKLRLVNNLPADPSDQVFFRYTMALFPQCNCCDNLIRTYTGGEMDTTIICPLVGNNTIGHLYSVSGVEFNSEGAGSEFVAKGDTTCLTIFY